MTQFTHKYQNNDSQTSKLLKQANSTNNYREFPDNHFSSRINKKSTSPSKTENSTFVGEMQKATREINLSNTLSCEDLDEELIDSIDISAFLNSLNSPLNIFLNTQNQEMSDTSDSSGNGQLYLDRIKQLQELSSQREPIVNFNKEKLSLSVEFPSLYDIQKLHVQLNPETRSITASILTSQETAQILQSQVSELEERLARHKIKLESLQINFSNDSSKEKRRDQNHDNRNSQTDKEK